MSDLQHPPPVRRPSSSMFQKPFVRSLSRVSLAYADLDSQHADNGSFQLKGFRHVSGTSVDGHSGLDEYISRVKRDQARGGDDLPIKTPETPVHQDRHSVFNTQAARPSLSRPPSITASLGSCDDSVTASGRVSVAAFRKGIRRPGEGPGTMSDLGHGAIRDDDDVPLGLLARREGASRAHSSASLSSLRSRRSRVEDDPPESSPPPSPAPSPNLAFTVRRHNRNAGGSPGFIVKSAKTTRTMPSPIEVERAVSDRYIPPAIVAASASINLVQNTTDYEEIVKSPISPPVDNYFSVQAPVTTSIQRALPAPLSELIIPDPAFIAEAIPAPSSVASPGRAPPPVEPLSLPQPGDTTPSSQELPLPPDEMPDTPPRQYQDLASSPRIPASSPRIPTSPGRSRALSLLEDPLRLFSGLWPGSPPADDSALELASPANAVGTQGNTEDSFKNSAKSFPRPPARATLSDTTAILSDERGRSSLHSRLAMAASGLSRPTPALSRTENYGTSDGDGYKAEQVRSAASDSGTASPLIASYPLIPATLPPEPMVCVKPQQARTTSARKSTKGWSSGESEDETDVRPKPSITRRVPSGPRRLSTQKRDHFGNVPAVHAQKRVVSEHDSSSEDESLSALREKASRSSLSLANLSERSPYLPATSVSSVSVHGMKLPYNDIPPVPIIPAHHQSRMPSHSPHRKANGPTASRSPGPVLDHLPDLSTSQGHRLTASPASSQSGVTSDSIGRNPVTPHERPLAPTSQSRQAKAGEHSQVKLGDSAAPESEPVCVVSILENQKLTSFVGHVHSACTNR